MNSYKDLEVYQQAFQLAEELHYLSLKLPKHELYELGSQVRRSAQGLRANIAEGYGRRNYKKDFIKFLTYAEASLLETESHIEMIISIYNILGTKELLEKYNKLGKQLNTFIKYVEQNWKSKR
ncbi:four helix bundle protein [Bacteroidota bacterium]